MFRFTVQILIYTALSSVALAKRGESYTYSEPVVIGAEVGEQAADLATLLDTSSRFNYYENQSLRSFSSVFVGGVDQRFFETNYNGFSLRDPSSTSGIFNMASLAALKGNRLLLTGGASLEIAQSTAEKSYIQGSLSNLKEFSLAGEHKKCGSKGCSAVEVVAQKTGGFSQVSGGLEEDFSKELNLSWSQSFKSGETRFKSHLLYYGQILDLDSLNPSGVVTSESETAESLNSVLFAGQEVELFNAHNIKISYTSSYRNQKDLNPDPPSLPLSFRQRGEVFEMGYSFKNHLNLKIFNERFNLYSSKGLDTGFKMNKLFSMSDFVADVSLGKTKLRSAEWSVELGYKNFVLFYKGLPPSLFQQAYNDEFSVGLNDLNAQEFLGAKQSGESKIFDSLLKWNLSYSRIYRFVDFDSSSNSYENLGEVENFFAGLSWHKGPFEVFMQNQVSRQIRKVKKDLPRRAPWTLGLRYKKKMFKQIVFGSGVRWLSKRKAFDQSDLKATWMADIHLSYKSVRLTCTNVFAERDPVFKNLGRRPFTANLSYQKNF